MDTLTRRHFLARSSGVALGFAGLQSSLARGAVARVLREPDAGVGYGPLVADTEGIFDLPEGFTYRIVGAMGETMDDGLVCPGRHDAMAAFPYKDDDGAIDPERCIIVRNHEIDDSHKGPSPFGPHNERADRVDGAELFDAGHGRPSRGGCTTMVYNLRRGRVERSWLSLAGTERNCAGGLTPWGSWISCEESVVVAGDRFEHDHGWCFEVPVTRGRARAEPRPIRGMGRFNHEAVGVDPETSIVYQTEDRHDGLLYRFVPERAPERAGDLHAGGTLQALAVMGRRSLDTRNWDGVAVRPGERLKVGWVTLDGIDAPADDLRVRGFEQGAARFARGEGMWWGGAGSNGEEGAAYFACTNGGAEGAGQIWRLTPSREPGEPDTLELFIEPNDRSVLENADNITVAPWGDMVVCEDGEAPAHLVGVTPGGELFRLARNAYSGSELAGACFSTDGSTLFVNIQNMGWTLAVTGPWRGGR